MTLQQRLAEDLKEALRRGDVRRKTALRLVLSGINYAEIAKQAELDDSDVLGIIAKEARQHQESIEAFKKGNRQDLVAEQEAELAVLNQYLPKAVGREEIIVAARQLIKEVGAQGPRDKGKVMPRLIAQFKGRAEGRDINAVVSELLEGSSQGGN